VTAAQTDGALSRTLMTAADAVFRARRDAPRFVRIAGFETAVRGLAAVGVSAGAVAAVVDHAGQVAIVDRQLRARRQAGQRERRLAALRSLDSTQCVVDPLSGLMARVVGYPGLPARLSLVKREAGIEVRPVALLEITVAVMHEAMTRDARGAEREQAQDRERHSHVHER